MFIFALYDGTCLFTKINSEGGRGGYYPDKIGYCWSSSRRMVFLEGQ